MNTLLFEKSLTDLVKGIRGCKPQEVNAYISQCIAEIKVELGRPDEWTKAGALKKLTFLQMMGYPTSWANFAAVEVMSSHRFAHKRVGYLAASQGFDQDTEVVLLTTNLLRKEITGGTGAGGHSAVYGAGLAVNCLSNICTADLARELLPDLCHVMVHHSHPYLRKKAVLCSFKLLLKHPAGLRTALVPIVQCLDDPETAVSNCAINVVTELSAVGNPRDYLDLAPKFFHLLTGSANNWMVIKVVKLLGSLVAEEPRLARKLLEPMSALVESTSAKSLLYEAVYTLTLALPYCRRADGSMHEKVPMVAELCAQHLWSFLQESDQNLKYLGLVGFQSLTVSHPKVLMTTSSDGHSSKHSTADRRDLVLRCLSDDDVTIRSRALELLGAMTTRRNLVELVGQLLHHVDLATGRYRDELVATVVGLCHHEKYARISDFAWYVSTLLRLARIGVHGALLAAQITDVVLRVLPVRPYAVGRMVDWIMTTPTSLGVASLGASGGTDDRDLLYGSAAWIVGEYYGLLLVKSNQKKDNDDMQARDHFGIIEALTRVKGFRPTTQAICIQAAVKVFSAACNQGQKDNINVNGLDKCVTHLKSCLTAHSESIHKEVQERAFTLLRLLDHLNIFSINTFNNKDSGTISQQTTNNDDEEEEEEDETTEHGQPMDAFEDILNLDAKGTQTVNLLPTAPSTKSEISSKTSMLGTSINSFTTEDPYGRVAPVLEKLLTPEPMKPVSVKAQKKKRLAPPPGASLDLDRPIDRSMFVLAFQLDNKHCRTAMIENVNFTGLTNTVSSAWQLDNDNDKNKFFGDDDDQMNRTNHTPADTTFSVLGDAVGVTSSQRAPATTTALVTKGNPKKQADPFYLHGGDGMGGGIDGDDLMGGMNTMNGSTRNNYRFNSIKLGNANDDDDDDEDIIMKTKNKKKKKKKKGSSSTSVTEVPSSSMLSSIDSPTIEATPVFFDGDDDDDDDDAMFGSVLMSSKKKKQPQKSALAHVDLTQPPTPPTSSRKTYPMPSTTTEVKTKAKPKIKKSKKSKKSSSGKSKEATQDNGGGSSVSDLLGFGTTTLASTNSVTTTASPSVVSTPSKANGVSPFDDFMGLQMTPLSSAKTQTPATVEQSHHTPAPTATTASRKERKLWMTASLVQPPPLLEGVVLQYRTFRAGGGATLRMRLKVPQESTLRGVSVSFRGPALSGINDVSFGDVDGGTTVECPTKVGPVPSNDDGMVVLGASLRALGGATVDVELTLPTSLQLLPENGLTPEDLAEEFASSSSSWESRSVKIRLDGVDVSDAVPALSALLRTAVVGAPSAAGASTLAARSRQDSTPVRFLIKTKPSGNGGGGCLVKIDVKSTDRKLCRSLASDLKLVGT